MPVLSAAFVKLRTLGWRSVVNRPMLLPALRGSAFCSAMVQEPISPNPVTCGMFGSPSHGHGFGRIGEFVQAPSH